MELHNQVNVMAKTFVWLFSVIYCFGESVWIVRLRRGNMRINTGFARAELILWAVAEDTLREGILSFLLSRNLKPFLVVSPQASLGSHQKNASVLFLLALTSSTLLQALVPLWYFANVSTCSLYLLKWSYPAVRKLLLNFKNHVASLSPILQWLSIPVSNLPGFPSLQGPAPGSLLSSFLTFLLLKLIPSGLPSASGICLFVSPPGLCVLFPFPGAPSPSCPLTPEELYALMLQFSQMSGLS